MICFVLVASALAVQNGAVLDLTGDAAQIEFGGALTLIHNATDDTLECSGAIKAADYTASCNGTLAKMCAMQSELHALKGQVQRLELMLASVMSTPSDSSPSTPCVPSVTSVEYVELLMGDYKNLGGLTYSSFTGLIHAHAWMPAASPPPSPAAPPGQWNMGSYNSGYYGEEHLVTLNVDTGNLVYVRTLPNITAVASGGGHVMTPTARISIMYTDDGSERVAHIVKQHIGC